MRQSLSRIEHEYVLQTIRDSHPAFSAVSSGFAVSIPQGSYEISENRIRFQSAGGVHAASSSARFFFKHKMRGFYFDASLSADAQGFLSFEIAPEIFKDDREDPAGERGCLVVALDSADCKSFSLDSFPLDSVLIDPDVLSGKLPRLQVLAERCGISGEDVLLPYRLYEYLESLSSGDVSVPEPLSGHLLFIDHRYALSCVTLSADMAAKHLQTELRTGIRVGSRRVQALAVLCGVLKITATLTALCLDIASVAPEDKRFLYERFYREKYRGE